MIEIKPGTIVHFKKYNGEKLKTTMIISQDEDKLFVKNYNRCWWLKTNECEILKIDEIDLKSQNFIVKQKDKEPKKESTIERTYDSVINSMIKVCEKDQYNEFTEYFHNKIPNNCRFMKEIDYYKDKFKEIPQDCGVYVLLLEEKRIYIGQSMNILSRIIQHFIGIGSQKTYKYKPIKILDFYVIKKDDRNILLKLEKFYYDFYTEKYTEYTVMM